MRESPAVTSAGISFRGVRKSFDGVVALDGLDLDLRGTGVIAIIGPNGAGKTTLLDLATARLHPDVGRVEINGLSLSQSARPNVVTECGGVARTFQELRIFRRMTVLENLMVARRAQAGEGFWRAVSRLGADKDEVRSREKALRVLQEIHLDGVSSALAGELSYGQQKLVTLAQCLVTDARILLLDEPVAGVHPQVVEAIVDVLLRVGAGGKLVVMVDHDIAVIRRVAARVIVMDHGRVIADGAPADVLARPEILEAYVG